MLANLIGWILGVGMQWLLGFIAIVMFASAAIGLGWSINFAWDYFHRASKRRLIRRRRRYQ